MLKSKGVKRSETKKMKHDEYYECLHCNKLKKASFKTIQSRGHVITTHDNYKLALSPLDDKRWYLDSIQSRAHGHYLNEL